MTEKAGLCLIKLKPRFFSQVEAKFTFGQLFINTKHLKWFICTTLLRLFFRSVYVQHKQNKSISLADLYVNLSQPEILSSHAGKII